MIKTKAKDNTKWSAKGNGCEGNIYRPKNSERGRKREAKAQHVASSKHRRRVFAAGSDLVRGKVPRHDIMNPASPLLECVGNGNVPRSQQVNFGGY